MRINAPVTEHIPDQEGNPASCTLGGHFFDTKPPTCTWSTALFSAVRQHQTPAMRTSDAEACKAMYSHMHGNRPQSGTNSAPPPPPRTWL